LTLLSTVPDFSPSFTLDADPFRESESIDTCVFSRMLTTAMSANLSWHSEAPPTFAASPFPSLAPISRSDHVPRLWPCTSPFVNITSAGRLGAAVARFSEGGDGAGQAVVAAGPAASAGAATDGDAGLPHARREGVRQPPLDVMF
jgi:hypothetical protein